MISKLWKLPLRALGINLHEASEMAAVLQELTLNFEVDQDPPHLSSFRSTGALIAHNKLTGKARIKSAIPLPVADESAINWSELVYVVSSGDLGNTQQLAAGNMLQVVDVNSGGCVYFCVLAQTPSTSLLPLPLAPSTGPERALVIKFGPTRLAMQAEQFANELTRHLDIAAPYCRIMRQAGSSSAEWQDLCAAAQQLPDSLGAELAGQMSSLPCLLLLEYVHGAPLLDCQAAFVGASAASTYADLGRLFLLDMVLGNADRLMCRELGWRGNPGNIMYGLSGTHMSGRVVAIDSCVQRRPPAARMSVEDTAVDRLAQLALNDAGFARELLLQDLLASSAPGKAVLSGPDGDACVAAFQEGLRDCLTRVVNIKGLLEMMHQKMCEWVAEFLADIQALHPQIDEQASAQVAEVESRASVPSKPVTPKSMTSLPAQHNPASKHLPDHSEHARLRSKAVRRATCDGIELVGHNGMAECDPEHANIGQVGRGGKSEELWKLQEPSIRASTSGSPPQEGSKVSTKHERRGVSQDKELHIGQVAKRKGDAAMDSGIMVEEVSGSKDRGKDGPYVNTRRHSSPSGKHHGHYEESKQQALQAVAEIHFSPAHAASHRNQAKQAASAASRTGISHKRSSASQVELSASRDGTDPSYATHQVITITPKLPALWPASTSANSIEDPSQLQLAAAGGGNAIATPALSRPKDLRLSTEQDPFTEIDPMTTTPTASTPGTGDAPQAFPSVHQLPGSLQPCSSPSGNTPPLTHHLSLATPVASTSQLPHIIHSRQSAQHAVSTHDQCLPTSTAQPTHVPKSKLLESRQVTQLSIAVPSDTHTPPRGILSSDEVYSCPNRFASYAHHLHARHSNSGISSPIDGSGAGKAVSSGCSSAPPLAQGSRAVGVPAKSSSAPPRWRAGRSSSCGGGVQRAKHADRPVSNSYQGDARHSNLQNPSPPSTRSASPYHTRSNVLPPHSVTLTSYDGQPIRHNHRHLNRASSSPVQKTLPSQPQRSPHKSNPSPRPPLSPGGSYSGVPANKGLGPGRVRSVGRESLVEAMVNPFQAELAHQRDMSVTLALKKIQSEARGDEELSSKVAHWKSVFRERGSALCAAVDEWQSRHALERVLSTGFLDGTHPIVDTYELKVRLDHMLRRLQVLQSAAVARPPAAVLPGQLYLGGAVCADSHHILRHLGIGHIVNATQELLLPPASANFEVIRIALRDIDDENISEHFDTVCSFISAALERGSAVLVHCSEGRSRSVTLVLAYLMTVKGWTLKQAYTHVRSVRKEADPNAGFMSRLMALDKRLHGSLSLGSAHIKKAKPEPQTCPLCGAPAGVSSASLAVHMKQKHGVQGGGAESEQEKSR